MTWLMRVARRVKFPGSQEERLAILQPERIVHLAHHRPGRPATESNEVLESDGWAINLSSFAESRAEPGTFFHLPKKIRRKIIS
jgi:hypothetical protein